MSLSTIHKAVIACKRCPRLRQHCQATATIKKREFQDQAYWGKPVPGFGDPNAWLWIVGLAPAAHGANRTGRMFTGDSSGNWLYDALFRQELASQGTSVSANDGLTLKGVYISAAARCAPPDNKPSPEELKACFPYLIEEHRALKKLKVILALGKIALDTVSLLLREKGLIQKKLPFSHGALFELDGITVMTSYHPSRQNTNTRRLTQSMWQRVFQRAVALR